MTLSVPLKSIFLNNIRSKTMLIKTLKKAEIVFFTIIFARRASDTPLNISRWLKCTPYELLGFFELNSINSMNFILF